jgi:manganese/zinc/iron transport system permease protein
MTILSLLHDLLFDYTLRTIALGSAILGVVGGVLGSFALLRRQGLLGDALSHAALPGICIAFMLTGSKSSLVLLAGAGVAGYIATLLIMRLVRDTRISEDAALGIVLSVFFGFGIMLLTFIQHTGTANQAGLDKYLFGQAATLVQEQVLGMAVLGGIALAIIAVLFKEFKLITFDPAFATTLGLPTTGLSILLTSLIVIAVLIGLQTVGVVLMAAMLIAPAAAARQWTERLATMLALAAVFGALSGVSGALLSVSDTRLPTGPMVILSATVIVIVSLLFGRSRGIVWDLLRTRRQRRTLHAPDAPVLPQHGGQQ